LPVHELTDIMTIKRKEESAPLNDDCVRAQESGTLLKKLMVSIYNYWIDDKEGQGDRFIVPLYWQLLFVF